MESLNITWYRHEEAYYKDGRICVPAGGVSNGIWDGTVIFIPEDKYFPVWEKILENKEYWKGKSLDSTDIDTLLEKWEKGEELTLPPKKDESKEKPNQ